MEKILLFFATLFVIPIILTLLYNGYIKFLLWRCKLIYDEKAGYWVLPFWAWMIGLIQFIRLKKKGVDFLYQRSITLGTWILYQYADSNYINPSIANDWAFVKICQIYFAPKSVQHC